MLAWFMPSSGFPVLNPPNPFEGPYLSPFYREASGGSERCWTKAPALGPAGSQSSSSSGAVCECWPEREAPAPPWPLGCHPLPAELLEKESVGAGPSGVRSAPWQWAMML